MITSIDQWIKVFLIIIVFLVTLLTLSILQVKHQMNEKVKLELQNKASTTCLLINEYRLLADSKEDSVCTEESTVKMIKLNFIRDLKEMSEFSKENKQFTDSLLTEVVNY
jgi:hypothetical protein